MNERINAVRRRRWARGVYSNSIGSCFANAHPRYKTRAVQRGALQEAGAGRGLEDGRKADADVTASTVLMLRDLRVRRTYSLA